MKLHSARGFSGRLGGEPRPVALLLLLGSLVALAGCRLDIFRLREGKTIDKESFEKLEVKKTTLEDALEALGAPDKLEWKSGDDYLWYYYADTLDVGLRFRVPFSFFGYEHNFLILSEGSDYLNTLQLVFNEKQVLEQKSLHLSSAYQPSPEDKAGWKLHFTPRIEHSVLLQGDAGVDDYRKVFQNGYRAGLDIGWQPVPVFTFLATGSYHEYQGDSLKDGADRIRFGNLQLYQMEIGVRLAAPVSLVAKLDDFEEVKRVLFEEDLSRSQGFRIYFQGTTGATINSNVPVKVNGARSGNFYNNSVQFSGTLGAGVEYGWSWGAAYLGVSYVSIDPFDKGNSPVKDDNSAFQSFLVGGGIDLKF
jgi:hypothetical protein